MSVAGSGRAAPAGRLRPAAVLRLGEPGLRRASAPVGDTSDPAFRAHASRLHATLADFRRRHGFGRAVSAPQIGLPWRFIALDLGDGPLTMSNPRIVRRSGARFTLWDDCMSFPELLVRVERDASIAVEWTDADGRPRNWDDLDAATSELLQHEIDHLDGVLAVDRALDRDSLVLRGVFEADPARYASMVDAAPRRG